MYDTLIIGSGPGGMSAALYLARFDRKIGNIIGWGFGGQLQNTEKIENYLGVGEISAPELVLKMNKQLERYNIDYISGEAEEVAYLEEEDCYEVKTMFGDFKAKTIIYATGTTHNKTGIEEIDEIANFCAICDADFYEGKEVVIVGGGETAFEDAEILSRKSDKVTLVHRRDTFRATPIAVSKLKEKDNVEIVVNDSVISVKENIFSLKSGKQIEGDGIFLAIGQVPNTKPLLNSLPLLLKDGYVSSHNPQKGFYAIGDVVYGNHKQVAIAVGDGARVAIDVDRYLTDEVD